MPVYSKIKLEFENVGYEERGKLEYPEGREPTQTQPTYDAVSGNQTRDTLVGGERSNHCSIPAPPLLAPASTRHYFRARLSWSNRRGDHEQTALRLSMLSVSDPG